MVKWVALSERKGLANIKCADLFQHTFLIGICLIFCLYLPSLGIDSIIVFHNQFLNLHQCKALFLQRRK